MSKHRTKFVYKITQYKYKTHNYLSVGPGFTKI